MLLHSITEWEGGKVDGDHFITEIDGREGLWRHKRPGWNQDD